MPSITHLDFEKSIAEVEEQIDRLQELARERGLDVSAELRSLERKLHTMKRDVYRNLTPIERVMVARHPARPERLYAQNHFGVFRSDDAGTSWSSIAGGLPADFGFPIVSSPTTPGTAWVVPLVASR